VTSDWILRRCESCGVLESDLRAVLVVDQHGDVVHVRDGMFPCGAIVDVLERDEVTS
jgi:predicted transcriptional regulator